MNNTLLPANPQPNSGLLDVLIKAGLVLALAFVCWRIFAPFLDLMLWAMILAVTLYPLHQIVAAKTGGKQGRASVLIVLTGLVLIVGPSVTLGGSLADSILSLVRGIKENTLHVPKPMEPVASLPFVGEHLYKAWDLAATDLPSFIHKLQPKIGELMKSLLSIVASLGGGILKIVISFIIAGVIMAFGQRGAAASVSIYRALFSYQEGERIAKLSTATIRAVAMGVLGVAVIQAIVVGLALMVAQVPAVGMLSLVVLVMGIAQLPATIILLPAIGYVWAFGDHSTLISVLFSVMLFLSGTVDNILKPLLLGRGVDAPMPVVLLGALGGMVGGGILGMFLGATLLTLGYQTFMSWVAVREAAGQSSHAE